MTSVPRRAWAASGLLWLLCACSGGGGGGGDQTDADGRDAGAIGMSDASTQGDGASSTNGGNNGPDGMSGGATAGNNAGGGTDDMATLRLEPASLTLVDDGVAPGESAQVRAFATVNGKERDVTSQVTWALDPSALLALSDGTLTTQNRGGTGTLMARFGSAEAEASITVKLEASFADPSAPNGVSDHFDGAISTDIVDNAAAPLVVYPSHETMFPRNLERVNYQWRAGANLDRFEVRFESEVASIRYYTTERTWLPSQQVWHWLADTHAGRSLTMSVRGLSSSAPSAVYRSKDLTLHFSPADVPGALYYWSTGAQGVLRATLSSANATKFFTDPSGSDTTCVSCHTVSRNGKRLAGGYDGEKLRQISIPDRTLQIPSAAASDGPSYGFGTYSPDASRLLYADKGKLTLLDAETGVKLSDVTLPVGAFASQPDWAPDGKHVAVAYQAGGKAPGNKQVLGTSLARIPVLANDTFGAPEVLVASSGASDSLYFPSYSPDSRYIAFVRGQGDSKDNVTATLWLVSSAGGTPVALTRLNERVRHEDGVTGIGNSMPTWAPSLKRSEFWLAFSSIRDYGDVLVGTDRDQLWGAAIDPSRIEMGLDPSYAAFWMPFQQLDEGNHRAFWTIDTEVACPSTIEICDELDNDCDGVVDENCCVPTAEICDNLIDDDCDGVVNDGCKCEAEEMCGNGADDDCDGQIDSDDDDCCKDVEQCTNGIDDDCDGKTDSQDDDCCKDVEQCTNGTDDDCDGKADGDDGDCIVVVI